MEQVFSYIISLGASVMMPILFTIIGLAIGLKFGRSLKSGLYVGVGFVGLGIVTALLTTNFGGPLSDISTLYDLQLKVFDMGWPAAAAVAYNTAVGALIIPICLGVNFLLLVTGCTRTVNIDLWNYWHFAFIGAVAYFVMDQSLVWGYFAAIVCYIVTLVMADLTADKFQEYYPEWQGISIPQPFCQSFVPFALIIGKALDKIPGFEKLNIDAEGMKKKFGVMGEPLILGVIVGALIGVLAQLDIKKVLFLGVTMGTDDGVDDLAGLLIHFGIDLILLDIGQTLHNDLPCRLHRNAGKILGRDLLRDGVAHFVAGLQLARFLKRDLLFLIDDFFHDGLVSKDPDLCLIGIKLDFDRRAGGVFLLVSGCQSGFKRGDEFALVDSSLLFKFVKCRKKVFIDHISS